MTPYEIELADALGSCQFLPASRDKRFCRNMADLARVSPDQELTLRQRHYMEIMAWRYRRQMPTEYVPDKKPLDLPAKVSVKKPRAAKTPPSPQASLDFGAG